MPGRSIAALALLSAVAGTATGAGLGPEDAQARRILEATGVKGGLVVHVGCGDGKLTAALRASDSYVVHGLDADARNVERARAYIETLGLYGEVSVEQRTSGRLPYAENMVNLLVAEDLGKMPMREVRRVLAPGGVAYLKMGGEWVKNAKPWPEDIDEWTHWLHDASGNAVAQDEAVGPPRRLQWIAKPVWGRHHNTVPSVTCQVSAHGRMLYIVDEAPASMHGDTPDKWALVARDAFNGLLLWRKPIADWGWRAWSADWTCRFTVPTHLPRRLVAVGDRVYVTLGFNAALSELDAATGEVLRTFEGTEHTDEILYSDGRLVVVLNQGAQGPGAKGSKEPGPAPVRKSVAAIDVETGRTLWKVGSYVGLRSKTGSMDRISHLSMVAGDGRGFFVDGDRLVCLSLADGTEMWRVARPEVPEYPMRYNIRITDMCSLVYNDGVLFFAQLNPDRRIDWREIRGRLHAFAARSGKELWSRECASWGWGHPADVFVVDGAVWVHDFRSWDRTGRESRPGSATDLASGGAWTKDGDSLVLGLDPATGEVKRKVSSFQAFDNGHHHRCYRNKATARFLMTSFRGLEFIDWQSGETHLNHWVRGTCRLGAFPCNGMVYSNPNPCECYIGSKLNGFTALAPAEEGGSQDAPAATRLERGPAFGDVATVATGEGDWPMFRHDPERSGSTASAIRPECELAWERQLGGALGGCTVTGDVTFVAVPARHMVQALRARDGSEIWSFVAGGRVDTPPTIHGGRALFGCADGWVYCVRASDGALVWRFRAAPKERLIGAFGDIESAWPVHGGVLVMAGEEAAVAYVAAGRSSFLDGGIWAYALDGETGRVVSEKQISTRHNLKVDPGHNWFDDTGQLADVLVAHGGGVYMRHQKLFDAAEGAGDTPSARGPLLATRGLRDDSWFSRTGWFLGDQPYGDYIVFAREAAYGVRARPELSVNGGFFRPGEQGYEVFAADRDPKQKPKSKRRPPESRWAVRVPVRVVAMALAGDVLLAAGTPDILDPMEPWAAHEGRRGGVLLAISTADGKVLREQKLDCAPAYDAMAAAGGRLFVGTRQGKLLCFR